MKPHPQLFNKNPQLFKRTRGGVANEKMSSVCYTWVRKGLDIARLPRVKLNNIQDLPGAKKKVVFVHILSSVQYSLATYTNTRTLLSYTVHINYKYMCLLYAPTCATLYPLYVPGNIMMSS